MNHAAPHRPAGLVTRTLAAMLDIGVVLAIMIALYVGWVFMLLLFSPRRFELPVPGALMSTGSAIAIAIIYLATSAAVTGRTVGRVAMGLRIVLPSGRFHRWPLAFARAALCVLCPVGLLWAAVDPQRRSFQDILLRTVVIYDWEPTARDLPG
ncbi:RDD family protein [Hoyosella altamirensis]|uniref:Putative RDD family membrane protein YckC n=1 Tax=Hoyosella altamirensis TaxID=616997 RepID=A0A839RJJ1_9ACTN|nr:RDD family protein [Hoyosella altamirensis]MBB3036398.1 putative RDD family membrane protein YckC [Hoyosella altamirensis]